MPSADNDRYFFEFCDHFCELLHLIIDRIYCMAVSFYFFILAPCCFIYQILHVPKIKMTQHQHFSPVKKIIALDIQEGLKKWYPQSICTTDTMISFCTKIFRHTKQDIFCV